MEHLTPSERKERLARLLLRGAYLYARSQGWVDENNNRVSLENVNTKEASAEKFKKKPPEPPKGV